MSPSHCDDIKIDIHHGQLKTPKIKKRKLTNVTPSMKHESFCKSSDSVDININESASKKHKKKSNKNKITNDSVEISNDNGTTKRTKQLSNLGDSLVDVETCRLFENDDNDSPESVDSGCVADKAMETDTVDWDEIKLLLQREHTYASSLMKFVPAAPKFNLNEHVARSKKDKRKIMEDSDSDSDDEVGGNLKKKMLNKKSKSDSNRADNYEELKRRWVEKLNTFKKRKKSISLTERREQKALKKKLHQLEQKKKKKNKLKIGNQNNPNIKQEKDNKVKKRIYNEEGQLVFSKFDFGSTTSQPTTTKKPDLKQMLSEVLKNKQKVKSLEKVGRIEDAAQIRDDAAWKGALSRAEGDKVRDNPELLRKSLKRKESKKKASKKNWDDRNEKIEKRMSEKQNKRKGNLHKRKKDNLKNKMKKMKDRGHIVPGF